MKVGEINEFISFLKSIKKNKLYISAEFIDWSISKYQFTEFQATELFEDNKKKIIHKISDYISYCNSKYIHPLFLFDEYDEDTLISFKFSFGAEEKQSLEIKLNWRDKFNELIKRIDWREFEILSKLILKENHIEDITITKSQNDQGIDFYGYFTIPQNRVLPRFYNYFRFRIIGQVKHSENNKGVDHQKVASFGTEVNKLRKAIDNTYFKDLDKEFINSELPILGIFITNSYYPIKTKDFANEYGIIYWDGEQISQDLAIEDYVDKIFDEDIRDLSLDKLKKLIKEIST